MREPTTKEKSEILFAMTEYFNCGKGDLKIDEFDIVVTPGFSHKLPNCMGPVFIAIWPLGAEYNTVLIRDSKGKVLVLTDSQPNLLTDSTKLAYLPPLIQSRSG